MSSETWLWIVIGVLCVRSVLQQIYIRRLKLAMIDICDAMQRSTGIRMSDRRRGTDSRFRV